jgi:Na+-driven multidrug efflux pump
MGAFLFITGRLWLGIILTDDMAAVNYGMVRMLFVTLFMFVFGTKHVLTNSLQAFGNTFYTAITSLGCIFGIRMLWMFLIYPHFQTFHWLMAGYLVSWLLLMAFNVGGFWVVYARFKKGIVKRI